MDDPDEDGDDSTFASYNFSADPLDVTQVSISCEKYLSLVEGNLKNGAYTLSAVRFAVDLLLKLEASENYVASNNAAENCSLQYKGLMDHGSNVANGDAMLASSAPREKRKAPECHMNGRKLAKHSDAPHESSSDESSSLLVASGNLQHHQVGMNFKFDQSLALADKGEAGIEMETRIQNKLALRQCRMLVNLITHCLLLSMDQKPVGSAFEAKLEASTQWAINTHVSYEGDSLSDTCTELNNQEKDTRWLYGVLVDGVLSCKWQKKNTRENATIASLDWLIGYLAMSNPGCLLKAVVYGLFSDLVENKCQQEYHGLELYMRRVGILEFVALRYPEQTFATLFPLLPFPSDECALWQSYYWIVLAALCPTLLAVFAQNWDPKLATVLVKALTDGLSQHGQVAVPHIWNTMDAGLQDFDSASSWIAVIFTRRINQLAPVAVDVVLFLDMCSKDINSAPLSTVSGLLLSWLNKKLSSFLLLHYLGGKYETGKNMEDASFAFMESLKQKPHQLWGYVLSKTCSSRAVNHFDPIMEICYLILLCCERSITAELLAEATKVGMNSVNMVMKAMKMLAAVKQSDITYKLYVQNVIWRLNISTNAEALSRVIALQKILDPQSWTEDSSATDKFACQAAWKLCHKEINAYSIQLCALLQRENAIELRKHVISVYDHLSINIYHHEVAIGHLKVLLGVFFHWLKEFASMNVEGQYAFELSNSNQDCWEYVCTITRLKQVLVRLAAFCSRSFTVMANAVLDFSFTYDKIVTDEQCLNGRRINCMAHSMSSLAVGFIDRYGRLTQNTQTKQMPDPSWRVSSSDKTHGRRTDQLSQSKGGGKNCSDDVRVMASNVASLLRQTVHKAIEGLAGRADLWPRHPCHILETLLVDRLETPHELPLTMEQYEEAFPKQVTSARHMFLTGCFNQNPLLLEMLQLIVEKGESSTFTRCAEFLRAMLADSISQWNNTVRSQHAAILPTSKIGVSDLKRMQLYWIIQLIGSAGWLPQPLAACAEVVSLIDETDVGDLLLLVWRCMHHALAFGPKAWDQPFSHNQKLEVTPKIENAAPEDEIGGSFEWQAQLFTILRQNISRIGAHFVQVYPTRIIS